MYNRNFYIEQFEKWKEKPLIKVITGIRRSGKSTLLKLFIEKLKNDGVNSSEIIFINKESLEFEEIQNYHNLYKFVKSVHDKTQKKLFLFIDEVQLIESWEKAVISLFSENAADIYIAGSNAGLMSSELASLLSGRYIEIKIFPLTFSEFLVFRNSYDSLEEEFNRFLKIGGLPGIHHLQYDIEVIYEYINSIFDTIVLKDIVKKHSIRNVAFLEKIILFILDNVSQIFSAKRVVDFLKKENRRTNTETVYNYIRHLQEAFIIQQVPRYDIKGKRFLEVREKYYLTEIGLRNAVLGYKKNDINQLLENIVYIELRKRGYQIYTGQFKDQEIDFIIEKHGKKEYIQVTYLLSTPETIKREFGSLISLNNNYPKYVISADKFFPEDYEGIIHKNIIDFLLEK